jgi:hypothetical protein
MAENLPLPIGLQENSLPLNTLADGKDPNDVMTWNGTTWVSEPAGGGGATNIDGTANQINVDIVNDVAVISLNNDVITPGPTSVSANTLTNTFTSNKTSLTIPKYLYNFTSTYIKTTGTGYQTGYNVYADSGVFDNSMIGSWIIFENGSQSGLITSFINSTTVSVTNFDVVTTLNFTVYSSNMNVDDSLNFGGLAKAGIFSVLPQCPVIINGVASQNGNIVSGTDANFTLDMVGKRLIYLGTDLLSGPFNMIDAGIITQVNSTTELLVDTDQIFNGYYYNIVYPGFYVDNIGQSFISGKAMESEQVSASTALSTSLDSIINSTAGTLSCTLADGIENQIKTVKLKYIWANPVNIKCTFGSFTLTTNEPVRVLRYLSGMWQIEDGVSACAPTPDSFYPTVQSGTKFTGTGITNLGRQGISIGLSADGNILALGGRSDNFDVGATWIFTRSGTAWIQQTKLVGTGRTGTGQQGISVALNTNGDTLAVGANADNTNVGATWIFTRSGTTWTQQGTKLVGTGNTGPSSQGDSVALSADGNTLIVGGNSDNTSVGAVWVFTRSGTTWTQQGTKLVGTGGVGLSRQGSSIAVSADGNMLVSGGYSDNTDQGAVWIFTRSGTVWTQQRPKLVGTGNTGSSTQGKSVGLSADGLTLAVGGYSNNSFQGACWIFTRSGTDWIQQAKLIGTGATGSSRQGWSCAISADGNTLSLGGYTDNNSRGACWIFTRSGTSWVQQGTKLVGTGNTNTSNQGQSCALSASGNILAVGAFADNNNQGAAWIFV